MELKTLLRQQLSETEAIVYLLLNSGDISQSQLAKAIGFSHTYIGKLYDQASEKIAMLSDAKLLKKG